MTEIQSFIQPQPHYQNITQTSQLRALWVIVSDIKNSPKGKLERSALLETTQGDFLGFELSPVLKYWQRDRTY